MSSDPVRLLAFEVLSAVADRDAYANLELSRLLRERGLTGRDAAFATELVSGTLRMQGTYDVILDSLAARSLDPPVRNALRLGAHQLLSMRVPPHAAVATTVSLVRDRIGHRPAGFANAILRRVTADDLEAWTARLAPDPVADVLGYLVVAHSHPRWVVETLANALDRPGELAGLLAADNAPARVTLVALPGLAEVAELPGRRHPISSYAVELDAGDPGALPAVREGRAGIQDAGSQLVAMTLAEAPVAGRDERWLDMCAGPGGKTALLAALAEQRNASVLAVEPHSHRAALVVAATRAARAGLAGVVLADGTVPAWAPGTFDRVLVDAPCSGLGALRRRPESRWRRSPEDIAALVPLQTALLKAACDAVRPGGVVVYATCSPAVEETSEVVGAVAAARTGVRLEPLVGPPDSACPGLPGAVQLWPHRHGTDAMFLALLRRTSG